jgi:hypothetical protein
MSRIGLPAFVLAAVDWLEKVSDERYLADQRRHKGQSQSHLWQGIGKMMNNNIAGKVVVIAGASGRLGEASARPDLQGYLIFRVSCLALNDLQPAGNRR